jgi:hypothetical protein
MTKMVRYKVKSPPPPVSFYKRREAFIILRVDGEKQRAKIEYEGDPVLIDQVEWAMRGAMDSRGHMIDLEDANALDLWVAVHQPTMRCFEAELIEGREISGYYANR